MNLIDTIRRVPRPVRKVLQERKELTRDLFRYLEGRLDIINEIVLIGSGTSGTSCQTSKEFVETASGISTTAILPNIFLEKRFIIQTLFISLHRKVVHLHWSTLLNVK